MRKILLTLMQVFLPIFVFSQNLASIIPNSANAGQTLNVTITGTNTHFNQGSGTYINFGFNQGSGTILVNSLNILSNTSILANITVPSNTYTGDYDIYAYNDIDGYLSLNNGLYVNGLSPLSLISISPNSANAGQTLNVTITGTNTHFSQGSETFIDFGFNQGSGTTVVNSLNILSNTSILANITVPPNTYTGDYDVSAYNYIDGYLSLNNGFYVNGLTPPSLVSISPNNANAGQTLNVTITGTNTHFSQGSGTFIDFDFGFNQGSGTTVVNSLNILSNTSILANITVPPNTYTGDYDVYAYNSTDGYLSLNNGFYVNGITPPSLVSISPNSANAGQTLNVTITGTNTHFSQGSGTFIDFDFGFNQGSGTTVVNSLNILSNTSILANITVPPNTYTGDYDVYAYNYIDGYLSLNNAFYVNGITPPSLVSISPNNANAGQTLNVTITGANTHFSQGSGTYIDFGFGFNQGSGTTVVNSLNILSNSSILANITVPPNTFVGDYDVYVYNSIDGLLFLQGGFQTGINGLGSIADNLSITIYPNPANEKIIIESTSLNNEKDKIISIFNIQGQMLLKQELSQDRSEVDISKFTKGIYILKIENNEGHVVKRFLKG
jgi:hypothetical protein